MVRVLAADDDPDILQLIELKMGIMGYEVVTVTDGVAALDAIRSIRLDLAILDVSMPGHSGLEVTQAARADDTVGPLPILLLSAFSTQEDIDRGLRAGADDYLTKPFSLRILAERVRRLVEVPPVTSSAS